MSCRPFAALSLVLLGALMACATAPATLYQGPVPPGRFEVIGRGPVTATHTSDLVVFEGVDGRDYAYTTTWGGCRGCYGDRMYAWDVTDPSSPVLTDSVMVDARVVNDVTVNAARTIGVITREQASSRRNGLVLLDLSVPAHPTVLSEFSETLTGGVHTTFIDGDLVYAVHNGTADLHVIDIADPLQPHQVGRWGVPAGQGKYLHDVWVEDGIAYLSYWNDGLVILDVGNGVRGGSPEAPALIAQARYRYRWRGREYGNAHMAVPYTNAAGHRYVFVGDEILPDRFHLSAPIAGGYLHVFDVSDLANPREVAWYRLDDAGTHNFWIEDDVLYMAYYNAGLRALDVSGELRGDLLHQGRELAAILTTDGQARHSNATFAMTPMLHKGLVYTADFNSGLWITRLHRADDAVAGQ